MMIQILFDISAERSDIGQPATVDESVFRVVQTAVPLRDFFFLGSQIRFKQPETMDIDAFPLCHEVNARLVNVN